MNCKMCEWWNQLVYGSDDNRSVEEDGRKIGWCTKNAPIGNGNTKWPRMKDKDGCGEYKEDWRETWWYDNYKDMENRIPLLKARITKCEKLIDRLKECLPELKPRASRKKVIDTTIKKLELASGTEKG